MNIHSTHSGGQRLQAERGLPERRRWPRYLLGAVVAAGSAVIAVGLGSSSASADDFDFAPDPFDFYAPPSSWGSADPYGTSTGFGSLPNYGTPVDISSISLTNVSFEPGGGSAVNSSSTGTELFAPINQVNSQTSTGSSPPNTSFQLAGAGSSGEQPNGGSDATTPAAQLPTAEEATDALLNDPYIASSEPVPPALPDPESGEGLSDVTTQPAEAFLADNGEQVPLTMSTELVDSAVPAEGEPVPTADEGSTGVTTQPAEVDPTPLVADATVNPEVSVTGSGADLFTDQTRVASTNPAALITPVTSAAPMSPNDDLSIATDVALPAFGVESVSPAVDPTATAVMASGDLGIATDVALPAFGVESVSPAVVPPPVTASSPVLGVNVRNGTPWATFAGNVWWNPAETTSVAFDYNVGASLPDGQFVPAGRLQATLNQTLLDIDGNRLYLTGQGQVAGVCPPGGGCSLTTKGVAALGVKGAGYQVQVDTNGVINGQVGQVRGSYDPSTGTTTVGVALGDQPAATPSPVANPMQPVNPPSSAPGALPTLPGAPGAPATTGDNLRLIRADQKQPTMADPAATWQPPAAGEPTYGFADFTLPEFAPADVPGVVSPELDDTSYGQEQLDLVNQPLLLETDTNPFGLTDTQFKLTDGPAHAAAAADPLVSGEADGAVLLASNGQSDMPTPLPSTGRMLASENCGEEGTVTAENLISFEITYTHCQWATKGRRDERNINAQATVCGAGAGTLATVGGAEMAVGGIFPPSAPVTVPSGAGKVLVGGLWAVGCSAGKGIGDYRNATFKDLGKACEDDGKRLGRTTVLVVTQNRFTTSREIACKLR
jgi:hypothetical protein